MEPLSPVPDTPEKLVKKHLENMVKRCPHPLCGSTEATLLCFDNGNLEQPRYLCTRCKGEFTVEGRYQLYHHEPTCLTWMCKMVGLKALITKEQYFVRRIFQEVDVKALTVLRRMSKEAAAKALATVEHKEAAMKALTAEEHADVRRMHMDRAAGKALMPEEQKVVLRMHKEAAAKASTYVRWMRRVGEEAVAKELKANHAKLALKLDEEAADTAFVAAKAKYALKLGNVTSQQKAAKNLAAKQVVQEEEAHAFISNLLLQVSGNMQSQRRARSPFLI